MGRLGDVASKKNEVGHPVAARKTGLLMSRPTPKKKRVRKQSKPLKRSVDPYAKIILRMLGDGMTASEVDAHMKWVPGKAKFILTEHWNSQGDAL